MSVAVLHFIATCYWTNLSHLKRNNLHDKQSFMIQFPAFKPQDKQASEPTWLKDDKKRRKKVNG